MRAKAYILTTTGEIAVQNGYEDVKLDLRSAIERKRATIEVRLAAGGMQSYPEETLITVIVASIVAIKEAK